MRPLSDHLNDELIRELRTAIRSHGFEGVNFDDAMKFILTDGMVPTDDSPVQSFLDLEDWVRKDRRLIFTTTDLKNKTGLIIERVLRGQSIAISRHGRIIAELRPSGA